MTTTLTGPLKKNAFVSALGDIGRGLLLWRLWVSMSWEDLKTTYKRSLFGVLWIALSFAAFVFVKIVIFSPILGGDEVQYFNAYLSIGFFAWFYIMQVINAAPNVFTANEGWIKNDPLPLSVFIFQDIMRELYNFAFSALVMVAVLIYLRSPITPVAFLIIPATVIYIVNAIAVKLFLGVVCTRFRDVTHFVQAVMRMMFFLVPIFWLPEQMGDLMRYLWWNPFFHYIEIFRAPLLDGNIALTSWIFVGIVTLIGWSLAICAYSLYHRRIVFWF